MGEALTTPAPRLFADEKALYGLTYDALGPALFRRALEAPFTTTLLDVRGGSMTPWRQSSEHLFTFTNPAVISAEHSIRAIPKAGGAPSTYPADLWSSGPHDDLFDVDGQNIYFARELPFGSNDTPYVALPLDHSGPPRPLTAPDDPVTDPRYPYSAPLAAGDYVYAVGRAYPSNSQPDALFRMRKDGAAPAELLFAEPSLPTRRLAMAGDVLIGGAGMYQGQGECVDGYVDTQVWVSHPPYHQKTPLVTHGGHLGDLTSDGAYLYWADDCEGGVYRLSLQGGEPLRMAAGPSRDPRVAIVGPYLYYSARHPATGLTTLYRVAR
ncbi:MAG TPA: hypothetical protein VFS43_00515 [Polyangiaceae bacterium]|nr:hypothetical protein [Polyangiaceae bacterium]